MNMKLKQLFEADVPLNNWKNDEPVPGEPADVKLNRPQKIFQLGMNKVQFLPSGGVAIRTQKSTITLNDEEASKLANMIIKIIGK